MRSLFCIIAFFASSAFAVEEVQPASPTITKSDRQQFQDELDRWMLQAYEGDRDAQFKVGVLFTNNQFKNADAEQAVYWYKQAARQGHALSQYNLGHQYLTGSGVKRSEKDAMKWWLKAAEQDHPLAQFNIGRGYYLGIGLDEDHSQSAYWFKRAASNNEPKSIDILNQLGWSDAGGDTATPTEVKTAVETTDIADESAQAAPTQTASKDTALATQSTVEPETAKEQVVAATDSSSDVSDESADESTEENSEKTNPIAVYTNPNKRAVLIAILDNSDGLEIIKQSENWTRVRNADGLPVWVHENFISAKGAQGIIKANQVNARSVPLITDGTIVGRLLKGQKVTILDNKKNWYRIISPPSFIAWVKNKDLNSVEKSSGAVAEEIPAKATPVVTKSTETFVSSNNENDWLFNQSPTNYTLQLASFDDPVKIKEFESRKKFKNNTNLRRFTSSSKEIEWTYYLYGSYEKEEEAKRNGEKIGQKKAWVRTFGRLQQNRCLAWKKQIPTPKTLNKYCS